MLRRWFSPVSLAWIFGHIILLALGIFFLSDKNVFGSLDKGISQGIGGSLVATGIAGMALFLYVRSTDTVRAQLEIFAQAGMSNIFRYRQVKIREEYDKRLANAREIDLVGLGLSSFREDYSEQFVAWSHQARVRVLVIDPDFPSTEASYADQRDREERSPVGKTRRDVLALESTIRDLPGLQRDRFEIRRMRAIPAINMLRIDHEIFWGPYLMNVASRNTPTMLVVRGGFLFDVFTKHFEKLWSDRAVSVAVPLAASTPNS